MTFTLSPIGFQNWCDLYKAIKSGLVETLNLNLKVQTTNFILTTDNQFFY